MSYRIKFAYSADTPPNRQPNPHHLHHKSSPEDRYRHCRCSIVAAEGGVETLLATGESYACPTDHPNKHFGRRLAFTNAVACIESREVRETLWNQYRQYIHDSVRIPRELVRRAYSR